jgi:uncharacterized protein (TIGR02246 family)
MRHAVEEAVERLDAAFAAGDLERVLSFYEDGAVVVVEPGGGTVSGREEIRAAMGKFLASGASARQVRTRTFEADGVALFLSYWTLTAMQEGRAVEWQLTATTVFRRQEDGSWKALIDNSFGPLVLGPRG